MRDLGWLLFVLAFFALTRLFVRLCARLG